MKTIQFEATPSSSSGKSKYNYTESQRNQYIAELNELVKKDVKLNEIKEAESVKHAVKFVTTGQIVG